MKKSINALYRNAQRNSAYYVELTKTLLELGKNITLSLLKKFEVFNAVYEDFEDYILFLIYYIYEHYDSEKCGFEEYTKCVMFKRLTSKILDSCLKLGTCSQSLDVILEDGTPLIELIPDNGNDSIPNTVSFNEIHLKISSPKSNDNNTERLKRRIYNLQNAGYTSSEIKKILNLKETQYRYLVRLLNKTINEFNYKIDLK